MAADKRVVIHYVTGRLSGIRRIVGHAVIEPPCAPEIRIDNGDGASCAVQFAHERPRYVLYREFTTPSLLKESAE